MLQASKITVPHFHEHNAEELRSRAAILRRLELREAARVQADATGAALPEPSSSEEDTDDDAFTRLHGVMQEQERAMYAGWTGVHSTQDLLGFLSALLAGLALNSRHCLMLQSADVDRSFVQPWGLF